VNPVSAGWLRGCRWFAGKNRSIARVELAGQVDAGLLTVSIVEVGYADGGGERYLLGLPLQGQADAFERADCQRLLFRLLAEGAQRGPLRFEALVDLPAEPAGPRLLGVEQSNTSIVYGREWVLKLLRRVEPGENRDLEVGRFLKQAGFRHTPEVGGAIRWGDATVGVLQRFVPNQGDGWSWLLGQLEAPPNAPDDVYWSQDGLPDRQAGLLDQLRLLGQVTGELHAALASRPNEPAFAPEPCTEADRAAWLEDALRQLDAAATSPRIAAEAGGWREHVRALAAELPLGVSKIQIHGDYHLGQVLKAEHGFVVIDFEGEPARPLEQRRAKQPAVRDVAGMLRSLNYAAHTAGVPVWADAAGEAFLGGWRQASGLPAEPKLLRFWLLAKAFYELNYELNNRPSWVEVPLAGVRRLMAQP
jgi:trehalose synthase-fused probable maltokinase